MKHLILTLLVAVTGACTNTSPRGGPARSCPLASSLDAKLPACCADCTCVPSPDKPAPHCPFCRH